MSRSKQIQSTIEVFIEGMANAHTRQNFMADLRSLEDYMGILTGKESKKQIIEFLRSMETKGLKTSTIRGRTIRLRQLYAYLLKEGFCKENPVSLDFAPKSKDHRSPKSPDLTELKSIFAQLKFDTFENQRDSLCICLMFFDALRIHEVCGIKKENLSLINGKMILEFSGKGGRIDTVCLFPQTEQVLKSFLKAFPSKDKKGPLIYSKTKPDKHLTTRAVRKRVDAIFRLAGVRKGLSAHSLRHGHAQVLASRGYPLTGVQRRLRHSSPMTSLKYYYNDEQSFYPSIQSQPDKLLEFKLGR